MKKQLLVNSKDRRIGSATDFEVTLSNYLSNNQNALPCTIRLSGINFSNAIFNVNSNNNVISFLETTGGTETVTLTQGVYSASTIATHLATVMTAATGVSNTYTGTYSSVSMKITIAANTQTFKFTSDYPVIGFTAAQTAALSLTGSDIPKLLTDYVVVRTNFAPSIVSSSNVSGSFLIPLGNCDIGQSIYIGRNALPDIELSFSTSYHMKFTLVHPDGYVIDNNGMDTVFFFEIL